MQLFLGLLAYTFHTSDAFTSIQINSKITNILKPPSSAVLYATKKQTRSSLLQPNDTKKEVEEIKMKYRKKKKIYKE